MSKKETNLDSLTEILYKKVPRLVISFRKILKQRKKRISLYDCKLTCWQFSNSANYQLNNLIIEQLKSRPISFYQFHFINFILSISFYQFYFINFILSIFFINFFLSTYLIKKFILYTLELISSKYSKLSHSG